MNGFFDADYLLARLSNLNGLRVLSSLNSPKTMFAFSVDKRTVGFKRRQEALQKSTGAMFDLLNDVSPLQLCARTVLFDSWFAFPKVIKRVVSEYPLHVICMLKSMHRVYYTFEGEKYTLNQLYKKVRKKRGRAKILASIIVSNG